MSKLGKTKKVLKFHRVSWLEGEKSLEANIRLAFEKMSDRRKRVFDASFLNQHLIFSLSDDTNSGGVFVRIFECPVDGLHDIDLNAQSEEACLGDVNDGTERKIVTDQFLLWVAENDVVSCNSKQKMPAIRESLSKLFVTAGLAEDAIKFVFFDVPRSDILAEIEKYGVKEIDMDITSFLVDAAPVQSGPSVSFMKTFMGWTASTNGAANKKARLKITTALFKRTKLDRSLIADDSIMKSMAITALEDESCTGLKMILGNGRPYRSDTIRVQKSVDITRTRNVYDYFNARLEVNAFVEDLRVEGIIKK